MASAKVYVATDTLVIDDHGSPVTIHAGDRIREGHPYLRGRENLFSLEDTGVRFDVGEATAPPVADDEETKRALAQQEQRDRELKEAEKHKIHDDKIRAKHEEKKQAEEAKQRAADEAKLKAK